MADTVVVTETRVDVVTVTGSGTTDTIQVTGDKQIEVLTVGVQGPQGPGSVLTPATTTTLGGIIVGDNLTITGNGVLSAISSGGGATAFAELTDVLLTSPASGDLVAYSQSNLKWINVKQTLVTDGGNF